MHYYYSMHVSKEKMISIQTKTICCYEIRAKFLSHKCSDSIYTYIYEKRKAFSQRQPVDMRSIKNIVVVFASLFVFGEGRAYILLYFYRNHSKLNKELKV